MATECPRWRGFDGVWALGDYNPNFQIHEISTDIVELSRKAAIQGYGKVVFLRLGRSIEDSLREWTEHNDG